MWYPDIKLTRTIRLAIMVTLIMSFFIISPIIIFYASGYRFDFNSYKIKKTGIIAIDVTPKDARMTLNNSILNKTSPLQLTNRAPGIYPLRIQRDGYLPWTKTIHVESNQTTYITNLYLFLDVLPTLEFQMQGTTLSSTYSSDGRFVSILNKIDNTVYEVHLFDGEKETESIIWHGESHIRPILIWSLHAPRLAILSQPDTTAEQRIETINAEHIQRTQTYLLTSTSTLRMQWQEHGNDILYVNKKKDILALSNGNIQTIAATTSSLWFVDSNEEIWSISSTHELWKNDTLIFPMLKDGRIAEIVDTRTNNVIVKTDTDICILWLDSGETTCIPVTHIFPRIYGKSWSTWILWSEWEVYELKENGDSILLTRTNEPLYSLSASTKNNSLFFGFDTNITAFDPQFRTTHILFSGESHIQSIATQDAGDYILFHTSINERNGIYKRML